MALMLRAELACPSRKTLSSRLGWTLSVRGDRPVLPAVEPPVATDDGMAGVAVMPDAPVGLRAIWKNKGAAMKMAHQ